MLFTLLNFVFLFFGYALGEILPVGVTAPVNQTTVSYYDLSKVPNIQPKAVGSGTCSKCQPDSCETCWETCGICPRPSDISSCPIQDNIGLTFDDGPGEHTPELLDILATHNIKATFCVIGVLLQQPTYALTLKRIHEEGHTLCSHTWSHQHLMSLTNEEIISEMKTTEDLIVKITGVRPRYVRPPFGEVDDRVRAVMEAMDYKILMWNLDTLDWKYHTNSPSEIHTAVVKNLKDTSNKNRTWITLMHDIHGQSVRQVSKVIQTAKHMGLGFLSAGQCLGDASIPSTLPFLTQPALELNFAFLDQGNNEFQNHPPESNQVPLVSQPHQLNPQPFVYQNDSDLSHMMKNTLPTSSRALEPSLVQPSSTSIVNVTPINTTPTSPARLKNHSESLQPSIAWILIIPFFLRV